MPCGALHLLHIAIWRNTPRASAFARSHALDGPHCTTLRGSAHCRALPALPASLGAGASPVGHGHPFEVVAERARLKTTRFFP